MSTGSSKRALGARADVSRLGGANVVDRWRKGGASTGGDVFALKAEVAAARREPADRDRLLPHLLSVAIKDQS